MRTQPRRAHQLPKLFPEHLSEYVPYFIKSNYPHLVEEFNIPLDEYPRRCVNQIAHWKEQKKSLRGANRTHSRSLHISRVTSCSSPC